MKRYRIEIAEGAMSDLENLSHTIKYIYKSPLTSVRYLRELKEKINDLSQTADIYQIQTHPSLKQYGTDVRRINYKKMAVIYTIQTNVVYIHRIIAQSLINES